jgi:diguanylate cyclase (GGDEF)-like protein
VSMVPVATARLRRENRALRRRVAALEVLATTDPLTGLANRRGLAEAWRRERALARRQAAPCSVLAIDLDHFKRINGRYGHPGGDRVLRAVAASLTASVRAEDLVARVGGDEFLVLVPHADLATAKAVAERVQAALRQMTLPPAPGVRCTASIGAACRPPAGADELFAAADRALYRAKQRGRDRLVLGDDEGAA